MFTDSFLGMWDALNLNSSVLKGASLRGLLDENPKRSVIPCFYSILEDFCFQIQRVLQRESEGTQIPTVLGANDTA